MNRPQPIETARVGTLIPGSTGTVLGIFLGVAALVFVGSWLGRGLGTSTSTDLVAVEGRTSGAQTSSEGLIGALSVALQTFGVVPSEVEPVPAAVPEVVLVIAWNPAVEPDPAPSVVVEEEPPAVAERPVAVPEPPLAVAAALRESLALAPLVADEEAVDAEDTPPLPQETAATAPAPAAASPREPDPPRAPVPPVVVAAPPLAVVQPTRRPTRTSVPATVTRTPQPPAMPKPSATPLPTTVPRTPTPPRTAVPTAKPQADPEQREVSLNRDQAI